MRPTRCDIHHTAKTAGIPRYRDHAASSSLTAQLIAIFTGRGVGAAPDPGLRGAVQAMHPADAVGAASHSHRRTTDDVYPLTYPVRWHMSTSSWCGGRAGIAGWLPTGSRLPSW